MISTNLLFFCYINKILQYIGLVQKFMRIKAIFQKIYIFELFKCSYINDVLTTKYVVNKKPQKPQNMHNNNLYYEWKLYANSSINN